MFILVGVISFELGAAVTPSLRCFLFFGSRYVYINFAIVSSHCIFFV